MATQSHSLALPTSGSVIDLVCRNSQADYGQPIRSATVHRERRKPPTRPRVATSDRKRPVFCRYCPGAGMKRGAMDRGSSDRYAIFFGWTRSLCILPANRRDRFLRLFLRVVVLGYRAGWFSSLPGCARCQLLWLARVFRGGWRPAGHAQQQLPVVVRVLAYAPRVRIVGRVSGGSPSSWCAA